MNIATIIVHRNTPELVDRQVKQIQTMTDICKKKSFPNLKNDILVVDCGSDENKRTNYPSYWYSDPDFRGKCYGHNVGLSQLKPKRYDYYWFNHPDMDFDVDMNCLEKLLLMMEKNSEIGLLSPKHSTPYAGRDQKGLQHGWHKVSTCDYLSLLVRGECVEKIGFLNPDFKYCWGAIHEYSYLLYKNGWCVAYCDDAYVTHLGGSTYGKKHTKTISREEYIKRAKMFARKYFVENYGENWDKEFSRYLPSEVKVNTYKIHRKFWEDRKEAKMIKLLKKIRRKVREGRNTGVLRMVLGGVNRLFSGKFFLQYRDRKRIKQEVQNLNPWFYELEIFGVKVKPGVYPSKYKRDLDTRALINRQKCRKILLIDEVTKRFDFSMARILDIGCNCGYWSGIYITKYDADSMVGIEGRELFIKQASLYYKSLGIQDKALFIHGNIMEYGYDKWGKGAFDFVLCAGILYHIKDQEELLKKISYVNRKVLVIDTRISEKAEEFVEPNNLCFNAIEETRDKKIPKKDDLINLLHKLGYEIEIIPPRFKTMEGVDGVDDYTADKRICMFCRKIK